MAISVCSDNPIFIGIDVGGASFEAAWHRGGCVQYENRPDAIAAFVKRLQGKAGIVRNRDRADRRSREAARQGVAQCQAAGRDGSHFALCRLPQAGWRQSQVRHLRC